MHTRPTKNIAPYFQILRGRHTAHKRFFDLGPSFSKKARRALQDVSNTFFRKILKFINVILSSQLTGLMNVRMERTKMIYDYLSLINL